MFRRVRGGGRVDHQGAVVWLTGIPGAGKTTIGRAVRQRLRARGCQALLVDGDELRREVCADLGFSAADRHENVRRAGAIARLAFEQNTIVVCALVSPYREDREGLRAGFPDGRFFEVYVCADVETCRRRDPKGLYAAAANGRVRELTGVTAPYEAPERPDLVLDTTAMEAAEAAAQVVRLLERRALVRA